jgi:hypothetical protein
MRGNRRCPSQPARATEVIDTHCAVAHNGGLRNGVRRAITGVMHPAAADRSRSWSRRVAGDGHRQPASSGVIDQRHGGRGRSESIRAAVEHGQWVARWYGKSVWCIDRRSTGRMRGLPRPGAVPQVRAARGALAGRMGREFSSGSAPGPSARVERCPAPRTSGTARLMRRALDSRLVGFTPGR